jgi:subtilisin family serine protease
MYGNPAHGGVSMKRLAMAALAVSILPWLPACPGTPIPIPTPPPTEAYDCSNPPTLTGLIASAHPIKDRYIVVLKRQAGARLAASDVQAVAQGFPGVEQVQTFSRTISGFSAQITSTQALSRVLADSRVAYVQQEGRKSIRVTWGLDRVDQRDRPLSNTYDPGADGTGVNAAIIDTGVTAVADLEGRLSPDCFTAIASGGCADGHGHGTHVAGTIGGKTWGVAKKATLYAARVLDANGSGTDTDVIRGIEWVTAKKQASPDSLWVANMSLGGDPAPALDQAVCDSIAAGVVHAVAAGNESADSRTSSPARVVQALTAGATDRNDAGASFTNFGPFVDLFAPGVDIESARPDGGSTTMSGTSMASPHVAGGAVLYLQRHPASTPEQVAAGLVAAASRDKLSGIGTGSPNLLLYVRED